VSHIPVVLAPASVQGANAPDELIKALSRLYLLTQEGRGLAPDFPQKKVKVNQPLVDVILLVRGGGAMEDLWAFNDEALANAIAQSPVPVVCGIGHETDFTIADFVADLRAPTPTAAAELVAQPQQVWLNALAHMKRQMQDAMQRQLDRQHLRRTNFRPGFGRQWCSAISICNTWASTCHWHWRGACRRNNNAWQTRRSSWLCLTRSWCCSAVTHG
jgi:exodeoxyribonuclease VII large subunit